MTNKESPLVSIVVPCYNHEKYVASCILSIVNQDYKNIELIVLDDGSFDNSWAEILRLEEACKERFVRYKFLKKKNEGVSVTLNQGIQWAKGLYLSFIASDDEMLPTRISTLVGTLVSSADNVAVCCANASFMDETGKDISLSAKGEYAEKGAGYSSFIEYYLRNRRDVKINENFFSYETLLKGNYIPAMSMLWKRAIMLELGGFTPNVVIEDWDLWLRASKKYRCTYIPEIVSRYRLHGKNTSSFPNKMRISMDIIYEREFNYTKGERSDLVRLVAIGWIRNSRKLYKNGYKEYFRKLLRWDIWLSLIGIVRKK